jgi:hypothetical protein
MFNRPYRCVVEECQHYTMEEIGSFLWIGSMVATIGPPGFRRLWGYLSQAVKHYLFAHDAAEVDSDSAAANLKKYAVELEKLVGTGKVGIHTLQECTVYIICAMWRQNP